MKHKFSNGRSIIVKNFVRQFPARWVELTTFFASCLCRLVICSMSDSNGQWRKCFSEKYKTHYWFDETSGKSSWEDPNLINKKRKSDSVDDRTELENEFSKDTIAIIVPFRDVAIQKRKEQLDQFIPKINDFLSKARNSQFRIYIVEQSNDNRKFNRGKLLNIGFDLARRDQCKIFIFHDVDLLPSEELLNCYTSIPSSNPLHIAHVWDRYNKNNKYFGGIVSFSQEMFEKINGFPNNFWGEAHCK